MNKFDLAKKLIDAGYDGEFVRAVWVYAYNEQKGPKLARKRKPKELVALNEINVSVDDVEFHFTDDFRGKSSYF